MAGGWAGDGAEQEQMQATIDDAIMQAKNALPQGESAEFCQECDRPIPHGRRLAMPGVQVCIDCQIQQEQSVPTHTLFNRRGSKDSQLR